MYEMIEIDGGVTVVPGDYMTYTPNEVQFRHADGSVFHTVNLPAVGTPQPPDPYHFDRNGMVHRVGAVPPLPAWPCGWAVVSSRPRDI